MRKCILFLISLTLLAITGCIKTVSSEFELDNGDCIVMTLRTSGEYVLHKHENEFYITLDDSEILTGHFIDRESYYDYYDMVTHSADVLIIEQTDNLLKYNISDASHVENDILLLIKESSTGVMISSMQERNVVDKVFNMISFHKK